MRIERLSGKRFTLIETIKRRKKQHKPRAALQRMLVKLTTQQLRAELKHEQR
jgi:hypothetical protein